MKIKFKQIFRKSRAELQTEIIVLESKLMIINEEIYHYKNSSSYIYGEDRNIQETIENIEYIIHKDLFK